MATTGHAEEVPLLVDELPLVALAMAHAHGESRVEGAEELRVKESDRVEAIAAALRAIGSRIEAREDGWRVRGVPARPRGGHVDAEGDHRIAMLGAVAGPRLSREGVERRGRRNRRYKLPGLLRAPRAAHGRRHLMEGRRPLTTTRRGRA